MPDLDPRDYGVTPDVALPQTLALQATLDAAGEAGGGTVTLRGGRYPTATLRMRSGVTLAVAADATLAGVDNPHAYDVPASHADDPDAYKARWLRSLVLFEGVADAALVGPGTVDGSRVRDPRGEEKQRGPHTVLLSRFARCRVEGVNIVGSGNYAVLALDGDTLGIRNLRVSGGWDGVHARRVRGLTVADCRFDTGDDAVAVSDVDACRITRCTLNSACNGLRVIGPARDFELSDCTITGPCDHHHETQSRRNTLVGLLFQPGAWEPFPGRSGGVAFRRVVMHDVQTALQIVTRPGHPVNDVLVEDVTATGVYGPASSVEAWGDSTIDRVMLRRVSVAHVHADLPATANAWEQSHAVAVDPGDVGPPHVGARPLPAWGLYARNVGSLVLDDVALSHSDVPDAPATRFDATPVTGRAEVPSDAQSRDRQGAPGGVRTRADVSTG